MSIYPVSIAERIPMIKKIQTIINCLECKDQLFDDQILYLRWGKNWCLRCDRECQEYGIPNWCPLPDAEEEKK